MPRQPRLDLGMLMGGVVVDDQMQFETARSVPVELFEESQPFDVGMAGLGARDDLPIQIIERGDQRDRAMPAVIVRSGPDVARTQRQSGLRALQSLTLAFLVTAEYQRIVRGFR